MRINTFRNDTDNDNDRAITGERRGYDRGRERTMPRAGTSPALYGGNAPVLQWPEKALDVVGVLTKQNPVQRKRFPVPSPALPGPYGSCPCHWHGHATGAGPKGPVGEGASPSPSPLRGPASVRDKTLQDPARPRRRGRQGRGQAPPLSPPSPGPFGAGAPHPTGSARRGPAPGGGGPSARRGFAPPGLRPDGHGKTLAHCGAGRGGDDSEDEGGR